MPDFSDPVTLSLLYLFIGCIVWAFVFGTETWAETIDGGARIAIVIASVVLIVLWLPAGVAFLAIGFAGVQRVAKAKRQAF